ncbi:hypothetical protein F4809DRAFT_56899 [Biscogniauxia mediterranea]|nr:hypothetical protein F4809DRAFT_56899 [Biscogniauxia mediterranea]
MAPILRLPLELVASILCELDDIRFLPAAILTCRHFYLSFREHANIKNEVLQNQVGHQLLPYAVATLEAHRMPYPRQSLLSILHHEPEPAAMAASLRLMPLPSLLEIGQMHDIVQNLATDFSTDAWNLLDEGDQTCRGELALSPAETLRLQRAFYIVELCLAFFKSEDRLTGNPQEIRLTRYLSKHSPWENEQLGCIHDYLEKRISQASVDVLSHDIEFGELSIDYLTLGNDNYFKQLWISQGLGFIHELITESSYENKRSLLKSAFGEGGVSLCNALCMLPDGTDPRLLDEYTEEEINASFPRVWGKFDDEGPRIAWHYTHEGLPQGAWVMFDDNAGLRERAYVFWDSARLQRYNLLESFNDVPGDSSHMYTFENLDEMEESFNERSEIWQKGGQGYWSKGDESNITYPSVK